MAGRGCKTIIKEEDMARAEQYAFDGCQNGTICGLMGWAPSWLDGRKDIRDKLRKKRQERKLWLRQKQNAQVGNVAMAIFLGKNELGQTDRHDLTSGGESLAAPVIERSKNRAQAPKTRENT